MVYFFKIISTVVFFFQEIGFTPNSANQMKQHDIKQNPQTANKLLKDEDTKKQQLSNRQTTSLALTSSANNAKKEMPRTFADLSPSKTAPDLQFIALSYKVRFKFLVSHWGRN